MNAREGFQHVFHAVATKAENKNGAAFARRDPHFPMNRALLRARLEETGRPPVKAFDSNASADKIIRLSADGNNRSNKAVVAQRQRPSPAVIGAAQGNSTPAGIGTLCGKGARRG